MNAKEAAMNKHPLKRIVEKQKAGEHVGIYSCCSANDYVIEAAIERAKKDNSVVLIESTANQVDQFGGYTGMKPADFKNFVYGICHKCAYDTSRIFLGGDHLGPLTWTQLSEKEAMERAKELIRCYVLAGFTKIHVDTSMKVADDDPDTCLSNETIAERGAQLVKAAEEAYQELQRKNAAAVRPVYVVGSEVPIPGGAQGVDGDNGIQITKPKDFKASVRAFEEAFKKEGIEALWDDVIAVVVQPGVEEKDAGCTEYDRNKAKELMKALKEYPSLVFEGHSTDYQIKEKLKELIEDGVGILKVGPGLTFAMREGLFALAHIEKEAFQTTAVKTSHFMEILDQAMLKNPDKWEKYYTGNENEVRIKRKYSFSDRCRYYFPDKRVQDAMSVMIRNLNSLPEVPLPLLSQFMPLQYTKVREGRLHNDAESLIKDRIKNTIDDYLYATQQEKL